MKKNYLMFLIASLALLTKAQTNLVPNPSFENFVTCPVSINQAITTVSWSSYGGTSDYFNSCAPSNPGGVSVPSNMAGFQQAATGNAYCGLAAYIQYSNGSSGREYIGTKLISPLVIGTKYKVSFKTCLAGGSSFNFNIACNKLGAKFITYTFPYLSNPATFNSAQVYTNTIITDSLNWTSITDFFTADSNYTQIMLGNFFNNANTNTLSVGFPSMQAYYLIDDVSVTKDTVIKVPDPNPVGLQKPEQKSTFKIYPSPASNFMTVQFERTNSTVQYNLTDNMGRSTLSGFISNLEKIDLSAVPEGFYTFLIISDGKSYREKLVVKR